MGAAQALGLAPVRSPPACATAATCWARARPRCWTGSASTRALHRPPGPEPGSRGRVRPVPAWPAGYGVAGIRLRVSGSPGQAAADCSFVESPGQTSGQARLSGPWWIGVASGRSGERGVLGSSIRWGGRQAAVRSRGSSASRPLDRAVMGPGTPTPGSRGWWGRHGASGPDGGLRTRPGVGRSRAGARSRRRGPPGRPVGRPIPPLLVRPTSSGQVRPPPRGRGSRVAATRSRATRLSSPGWWSRGGG